MVDRVMRVLVSTMLEVVRSCAKCLTRARSSRSSAPRGADRSPQLVGADRTSSPCDASCRRSDGAASCKRSWPDRPITKVIIVRVQENEALVLSALEAGAVDFVRKPDGARH